MKHHPSIAFVLVLGLAACGGDAPPAPEPQVFELRDVVDSTLAALEAELAAQATEPDPVDPEQVRGLIEMLAGSGGGMRTIALDEATALGEGAVEPLAAILADSEARDEERGAAIEVLGRIDTPRSAEVLLERLEQDRTPWVRAHAAWRLGEGTQDWIVPRVILRLKYEKDHDTAIWIGQVLGHFGNYSGLGALVEIAYKSPDAVLRASAQARLEEIQAATGFEDPFALSEAWLAGDPEDRIPDPVRSLRFDVEVWRRLSRLPEFQLRGVDDSRWICSGLGPHTASILARALHDSDPHMRVHTAQCLERMGPRARVALDDLVAGLADSELCTNAANALEAIGDIRAERPLLALFNPPTELRLRLAAVRALGGLGTGISPATTEALRAIFDAAETPELHQAAGESLIRTGSASTDVVRALAELLVSELVEPVSTETVLRTWIWERIEAGEEAATPAFEAWDALTPPDRILTPEEIRAPREGRRDVVLKLLAELSDG